MSRFQKGKTNLDFSEARDSEWQLNQPGHMHYASVHLAPDRQPRQHPTTQFFTGRMPFLSPNQQRQSTEGNLTNSVRSLKKYMINRKRKIANKCHPFCLQTAYDYTGISLQHKKVKAAHTRLPSVGLRSWSRFLAVSLQVTWVINPTVGCHYFPPGLQLPPQPLRGLLPISLLGEQRHNGCEQFA